MFPHHNNPSNPLAPPPSTQYNYFFNFPYPLFILPGCPMDPFAPIYSPYTPQTPADNTQVGFNMHYSGWSGVGGQGEDRKQAIVRKNEEEIYNCGQEKDGERLRNYRIPQNRVQNIQQEKNQKNLIQKKVGFKKVLRCELNHSSHSKKEDKQYNPTRHQKKVVRRRLHSNQNRNILPNQISQILSYLQKKTKSGDILQRVMKKYPPPQREYNSCRFYTYQAALKEKIAGTSQVKVPSYLRQPQRLDCAVWQYSQQEYYIKLTRILIRHFLNWNCVSIILTSKRMDHSKRMAHLNVRRQIEQKILG